MTIKTTESGTTLRNRLAKSIVLAILHAHAKREPDKESLDMAAFVVLALENCRISRPKCYCLGKTRLLAKSRSLQDGMGLDIKL